MATATAVQHDFESGKSGSALGKQLSVQLTSEQFEKLYLQPGGVAAKGDLSKRFGNPTVLGLASFLIANTPVACFLMGFGNSNASSLASNSGSFMLVAGIGLWVAGLLEFILGNTFPFGFINSPIQQLTSAYAQGAEDPAYNAGIAIYLVAWGIYVAILFVASLRTNVVFATLFMALDITVFLLSAAFFQLSYGNAAMANTLLIAGGAFQLLVSLCGLYLLVVLTLASTGFPCPLPVGDLSGFLKQKNI